MYALLDVYDLGRRAGGATPGVRPKWVSEAPVALAGGADRALPDRPAALTRKRGHAAVRATRAAGALRRNSATASRAVAVQREGRRGSTHRRGQLWQQHATTTSGCALPASFHIHLRGCRRRGATESTVGPSNLPCNSIARRIFALDVCTHWTDTGACRRQWTGDGARSQAKPSLTVPADTDPRPLGWSCYRSASRPTAARKPAPAETPATTPALPALIPQRLYAPGVPQDTAAQAAVTGIPTDGGSIFARLYSLVNGTWQSTAYTFVAGPKRGRERRLSAAPGLNLWAQRASSFNVCKPAPWWTPLHPLRRLRMPASVAGWRGVAKPG
jgi:hypothetical protein